MASKLQNICALSDEVGKSLSDYEKWTSFLKSAAWQYKYPFQDQILIYAQRPDATACASIDVWNKRLKSWINRGAKGIALLREATEDNILTMFSIFPTRTALTIQECGYGGITADLTKLSLKRLKILSVN